VHSELCRVADVLFKNVLSTLFSSKNMFCYLVIALKQLFTVKVRSGARACYRIFSRIWPERSRQLFSSFEPSRQKVYTQIYLTFS
jgi:hypothetical protein